MRKLEVKILDERIRGMLPHYATAGAAGLDLRACVDAPLMLEPGAIPWKSFPDQGANHAPK